MEVDAGREKSQVVPLLTAALICDAAVREPATRKHTLVGIWDRITVSKFPTWRPFTLYFKIGDAEGYYEFEVRYVKVSDQQIIARAEGTIEPKDRLLSTDLSVEFGGRGLPIPEEGRYELQVWANGVFLGATTMEAVARLPYLEVES